MNQQILLAIGLGFLALEHFDVPIPRWITGVVLGIVAVLMLFA